LDRFLCKLMVHSVSSSVLEAIVSQRRRGKAPDLEPLFSLQSLQKLFAVVDQVFLPNEVANYIARVVAATHPANDESPEIVRNYVRYGASPRAAIGLAEAVRALALIKGKPNVGFEDVDDLAPHVLGHRIALDYRAKLDGIRIDNILVAIKESLRQSINSILER